MKKTVLLSLLVLLATACLHAQQLQGAQRQGGAGKPDKVVYTTFIYTSDDLADQIAQQSSEAQSRGYLADLFGAAKNATKGMASGYVSSFIDMGVNAIGALFTTRARHQKEWLETVKKENSYQTQINTVSEVNDFYKEPSFDGAMDPKGMTFDGIGCLRKDGADTLFYISCHIDRSKIYRIINHSKFELVLDTLIVSPTHSNLPNTALNIPYSTRDRKNFALTMDIRLMSSWMNEIVQLQKDQELGHFTIQVPVDERQLDSRGFLRYVRHGDEPSAYRVVGESFIVPRSYMGHRDENDQYRNSWGTGEYKLQITLGETCEATDAYKKGWKADRKWRKTLKPQPSLLEQTWQTVTKQQWNEVAKAWVITTLKAPAAIISRDLIDKLGLATTPATGASAQASAMKGQGQGAQDKPQRGQGAGVPQGAQGQPKK